MNHTNPELGTAHHSSPSTIITMNSQPGTPGQEGPSSEPPSTPPGWIAQWDASSRRYYFVEISTGKSQWEVPTQPGGGMTPLASPSVGAGPTQPPGYTGAPGGAQGGERGMGDGQTGDRSLGSMAMQYALGGGGKKKKDEGGAAGLLNMAGSLLGNNNKPSHGGSSTSSGGMGGMVAGIAGSLLGGGKKDNKHNSSSNQNNYHGGNTSGSNDGGLMGKVSGFLGGSGQVRISLPLLSFCPCLLDLFKSHTNVEIARLQQRQLTIRLLQHPTILLFRRPTTNFILSSPVLSILHFYFKPL